MCGRTWRSHGSRRCLLRHCEGLCVMRTLIYDGQCRLCVTAKEGLERLGPAPQQSGIRFVPYQSEEAASRLGAEYQPGRPDVAVLVGPEGTVRRSVDAVRTH